VTIRATGRQSDNLKNYRETISSFYARKSRYFISDVDLMNNTDIYKNYGYGEQPDNIVEIWRTNIRLLCAL
jgi:hypothetical protein